jgi:hypothetical protein
MTTLVDSLGYYVVLTLKNSYIKNGSWNNK